MIYIGSKLGGGGIWIPSLEKLNQQVLQNNSQFNHGNYIFQRMVDFRCEGEKIGKYLKNLIEEDNPS